MDTQRLIVQFSEGPAKLRRAVAGLTEEPLRMRSKPGQWSIHEVVIHLVDSDAIAIDRMKRVLTEDNPSLLAADEGAYIDRLHPHVQSLEDALTLFEVGRRQFVRVLCELPGSAFHRIGTHNVAGELTLADLLKTYADHVDHHLEFIEGKRQTLGAT